MHRFLTLPRADALDGRSARLFETRVLAQEVFQRFTDEANALLQATVPVGGPAIGLTTAQSASLQARFDSIADGLETKVVRPTGTINYDDLVGVGHASWDLDAPSGGDTVPLRRWVNSKGSDYEVRLSLSRH